MSDSEEEEPTETNQGKLAAAQAEEKARVEAREKEVADSWTMKHLSGPRSGRRAERGLKATLHVIGRAHVDPCVGERAKASGFESGSVFEDSRERGTPQLLLLGRGLLVPGLDVAVLEMREGERAQITVKPEGGYGASGSVAHPCVPGSATLVYDVEVVKLEDEGELWDLSFEQKMQLAEERKQRGNALFKAKQLLWADAEYEQAKRYLAFNPNPEEGEVAPLKEATALVNLNLAATKLRLGREAEAVKMCEEVLRVRPEDPKALYRQGQAYNQLGKYTEAKINLECAKVHLQDKGGDQAQLAAVEAELGRLQRRQERHAAGRKRMAERMFSGDLDADVPFPTWRPWHWRPSEWLQDKAGKGLGMCIVASIGLGFASLVNWVLFGRHQTDSGVPYAPPP